MYDDLKENILHILLKAVHTHSNNFFCYGNWYLGFVHCQVGTGAGKGPGIGRGRGPGIGRGLVHCLGW
jgi:hypothetical protein